MGKGSYTANDWSMLRRKKDLTSDSNIANVFENTNSLSIYDSKKVKIRESRDVDDDKESTPIIIGFDATASMGYLAKELAINSINNTIQNLYEGKIVSYPQFLCSAIGDCKSDASPLQVTQFESDIRIIKQLTELYLEGGGGGNGGESYNLLWYFAAKHTNLDCFNKRKQKGYLFTIGDDVCHPDLSIVELKKTFNDVVDYSLANEELLRMAQMKFHVYHIHIETGHFDDHQILNEWKKILPGQCTVIHKNDINLLSDLITAIISVTTGLNMNEVLKNMDQAVAERIARSMANISIVNSKKNIITF